MDIQTLISRSSPKDLEVQKIFDWVMLTLCLLKAQMESLDALSLYVYIVYMFDLAQHVASLGHILDIISTG